MPWGNINFFKTDWTYAHSTEDGIFWVYGSITEDTLPKRYLDVLPLDPRTNNYYSYWKTKGSEKIVANQFELASVVNIDWEYQAKVTWNYTAEAWPYSLIREYSGSSFVYNKSRTNLPYNPEELVLIATVNWVTYREWDTITASWTYLEIFFSDGSVSILEDWWELTLTELSFPKEDNLNTIVKLSLAAWTIWTRATSLNEGSEFEVYTTDSTAAVRGTVFWVSKGSATETIVIEWEVGVYQDYEGTQRYEIASLEKGWIKRFMGWSEDGIPTIQIDDYEDIKDNFTVWGDIRGTETVENIYKEIEDDVSVTDTSCTIWNLTWTLTDLVCTAWEDGITPWTEIAVDLSWAFDIELEVLEVPHTKEYLLYWDDWSQYFKLFFDWWNICFQNSTTDIKFCKTVIDEKITISRDSNNEIILRWSGTSKFVDWYIESFYVWRAVPDLSLLRMNSTNKIDITIIK